MIYDYDEKEGHVSLWIGKCPNYSVVDEYLSTVYLEEDFDGDIEKAEQSEVWKSIFIPANKSRACEEELKNYFNYEYYNQFEYDFGLTFDEDFREACVRENHTKDYGELFDGFSYCDSFLDEVRALSNLQLPECNTAVALYNFKYEGEMLEVEHPDISLYFLGYFKYDDK